MPVELLYNLFTRTERRHRKRESWQEAQVSHATLPMKLGATKLKGGAALAANV